MRNKGHLTLWQQLMPLPPLPQANQPVWILHENPRLTPQLCAPSLHSQRVWEKSVHSNINTDIIYRYLVSIFFIVISSNECIFLADPSLSASWKTDLTFPAAGRSTNSVYGMSSFYQSVCQVLFALCKFYSSCAPSLGFGNGRSLEGGWRRALNRRRAKSQTTEGGHGHAGGAAGPCCPLCR